MVILTRTLTDEHKSSFSCYCWIPCNPLISTGLRSVLSPVCCVCLTLFSSSPPTLPGLTRLSALCSRIVPLVARQSSSTSFSYFHFPSRDQFNLESQTLTSKLPPFWILLLGQVSFIFYHVKIHVLNTLNVDIKNINETEKNIVMLKQILSILFYL